MAVITLSELKTYMGITGTDYDDQLTYAVNAADAYVYNSTGRLFGSTAQVPAEVHDYEPTIWLDNQDITAVSSVAIGRTSPDTLDADDFFYNEQGRLVLSTRVSHNQSKNDFDVVTVDYTHGIAVVPDDIKFAALAIGSELYNGIDGEVTEESVGSYRRVYRMNSKSATILDTYKKVRL